MHSWLVWLVFAAAWIVLGFVGYHFSVRTLRFVATIFGLAVVVVITRYGVAHQGVRAHDDLVNSFALGFNALSKALFQPLLGHNNPIPGRIGWLVIIGLLVFGYRELEVWAMHWEPPTVDLSALGGDQPSTQGGSASGGQDGGAVDKRHDTVANDLRFRLPAVAVRAPAVLPGGTKVAGLASIAESTGNNVGGLAGAIMNFVSTLWPNPRQYQVRIRVEPSANTHQASGSVSVTVDLENTRTGGSVGTKTLPARQLEHAGCVVAGYVAQQIFSADPTAPPWCYGSLDGSDLAAMLIAWQMRIYPECPADIRKARLEQMEILERGASSTRCAGVARYELAQLHDIEGAHEEALRLHALNREQYPRFYRGRYRLGMSLEMIASRQYEICTAKAQDTIRDCLGVLDRCGVTNYTEGRGGDINLIEVGHPLPRRLRIELLAAAQDELRTVRQQLTPWRLAWSALVHRDERAILKDYWRLAERERFHDAVRVAELLVAVRQGLIRREHAGSGTGPGQSQGDQHSKADHYPSRLMNKYNQWRAEWITTAITGDSAAIKAVLHPKHKPQATENTQPRRHPKKGRRHPEKKRRHPRTLQHPPKTRWVLWQRSTPSWQAAYNTACLYAALAGKRNYEAMAQRVVNSLTRAVNDPRCEMGRPSDWIGTDPDFSSVRLSEPFSKFFCDLLQSDNQEVNPVPPHH